MVNLEPCACPNPFTHCSRAKVFIGNLVPIHISRGSHAGSELFHRKDARFWSDIRGLNPSPSPWQGDALPNELIPQVNRLNHQRYLGLLREKLSVSSSNNRKDSYVRVCSSATTLSCRLMYFSYSSAIRGKLKITSTF